MWALRFEGREWHKSDLTVADAARVVEIAGLEKWNDPDPRRSPDHFAALLATFLTYGGESFDAALLRVSLLPLSAVADILCEVDDDEPAPPTPEPTPPPPDGGDREPRNPVAPSLVGTEAK